jgi:predicted  nucleic acid-binding Zn-ribbon protein
MGWLFRKKHDVLDLTERYKKQQERLAAMKKEEEPSTTSGAIGIFGMPTPTPSTSSGYVDVSAEDERKKKLAKRLMDITDRLEEISNQIYHLQQRIELLEKKNSVGY